MHCEEIHKMICIFYVINFAENERNHKLLACLFIVIYNFIYMRKLSAHTQHAFFSVQLVSRDFFFSLQQFSLPFAVVCLHVSLSLIFVFLVISFNLLLRNTHFDLYPFIMHNLDDQQRTIVSISPEIINKLA